jgi:hypothetical protein
VTQFGGIDALLERARAEAEGGEALIAIAKPRCEAGNW